MRIYTTQPLPAADSILDIKKGKGRRCGHRWGEKRKAYIILYARFVTIKMQKYEKMQMIVCV